MEVIGNTEIKVQKYPKNGFFIYAGEGYRRILFEDICYLRADGPYTIIHLINASPVLVSSWNLRKFEDMLDDRFFRIHRTYIVNLEKITEVRGNGDVILEDNSVMSSSKARQEVLFSKLKILIR